MFYPMGLAFNGMSTTMSSHPPFLELGANPPLLHFQCGPKALVKDTSFDVLLVNGLVPCPALLSDRDTQTRFVILDLAASACDLRSMSFKPPYTFISARVRRHRRPVLVALDV